MTSIKQNIINELNKPPGEIYKKNYWVFPKIEKNKQSLKKKTIWYIFVELFCNNENIEILDKYFNNEELQDAKYTASYYTTYKDEDSEKPTKSVSTIIKTGKNLGKKNQTNVFTQALMEARSKYNKKLNDAESSNNKTNKVLYAPMLLHIYKNNIDFKTKPIGDVYYIQKKLNGLRAIYNDGEMWSRQKKMFPIKKYIMDELKIMMKNTFYISGVEIDNSKLYLDGELYLHGTTLEELNSIARSSTDLDKKLEYHIFDLFYPPVNIPFVDRLALLNTIFQTKDKYKYLKEVDTIQVNTDKELKDYYKLYVKKEKYEGVVIRKGCGIYNLLGGRSHDVLKMKERMDEDMCLVDYTTGKTGKERGAIIFIVDAGIIGYKERLSEKELKPLLTDKLFNVVPNWTLEERYKLYNDLEKDKNLFKKKYYGAPIRVEFFEYSAKGVPSQARAIAILV